MKGGVGGWKGGAGACPVPAALQLGCNTLVTFLPAFEHAFNPSLNLHSSGGVRVGQGGVWRALWQSWVVDSAHQTGHLTPLPHSCPTPAPLLAPAVLSPRPPPACLPGCRRWTRAGGPQPRRPFRTLGLQRSTREGVEDGEPDARWQRGSGAVDGSVRCLVEG